MHCVINTTNTNKLHSEMLVCYDTYMTTSPIAHKPNDREIRIRRATSKDAAAIAHVHMLSRLATMPYLPPQKRTHEQVTVWVKDVLLKTSRLWVAEAHGEILGYAALEGDMLEHLYIQPEARRQGIGTRLLNTVKQYSPKDVRLHVFQKNTKARAFYERHGFVVVEMTDGHRNMENLPDMTLQWSPVHV